MAIMGSPNSNFRARLEARLMRPKVIVHMALKIFSNRLKQLRKERGLSQTDLAQRCNLNLSDISRYERGTVSPSLENFVKLAQALEVSSDELLFESSNDSNTPPRNLKLLDRLQEVDALDKHDQDAVLRLIDAMIAKRKMREVIGG